MQKFQNNIQDQFGNEITLATITVKNVVGGALSTLFSDNGATPLGNPFIAQDLSEFFFYATNNRYDIFITGPVIDLFLDVLLFDPADGGVDASTFRTGNFLFDADVSGSDPEAVSIKFNSVTPASITSCRIALADIDGLSIADLTALSLVGSRMRVWDELDSTQLQEFVVRTVPALDVDHFEFTVDFIAGTASMSVDDKRLRVQFELTSFLGAGITSNNQNSTLFWNEDKQWSGTDSVQVNPNTPEVGGRIRSPGSAVTDVSRAMVFHNVGNSIGGTLYAETEADQGFYLFADFNGSPRTWEFGYDSGAFNGILAFEDSPLGIVVFGAARYLQGEKSAAAADVVGFGQWWVRDDAPNTPMFTDDAGNDFELNADTSGGLPGVNGAKAFGSANQAIATGPGLTAVALNSEAYDTDSIHDLVTNNSRLTVPAGIARIRLSGYVKWQPNGSSFRILKITKNGALGTIDDDQAGYEPDMFTSAANASVPDVGVFIDSGIIKAVATDFFELEVSQESGVSLNLLAGDYWFQMDLIEEAVPPNIDEFSFDSEADLSGGNRLLLNSIQVTQDGKHLYCCRSSISVNDVFWFEMSVAYDLSTISFTSEDNADGQSPRGIFVREDGSQLFTLWRNATNPDGVFRWSPLSTPFDITTKGSRTPAGGFIVQPPGSNSPAGLHFKPDGFKFYITDFAANEVLEFTLDSAFDLTAGSHTGTFDTSGEVTTIADVTIDLTGTKMYVLDRFNEEVEQYNLLIPFDIDSAVASGVTPLALEQGTGTDPTGIHLTDNDTKLYAIYDDAPTVELYTI